MPIKRDEHDVSAAEHFHYFTILLASSGKMPSSATVELTGNWPDLWKPLWEEHIDYGSLLLSAESCQELLVDVYAPASAAEGEYEIRAAWPNKHFRRLESFDSHEKRFCCSLQVRDATRGEYDWSVRHLRKKQKPGKKNRKPPKRS